MVGKVTDHEFDECPCECCGECVFVVHPDKKPPDMYCRETNLLMRESRSRRQA